MLHLAIAGMVAGLLSAADPTFLRRSLDAIQPAPDDLTMNAKGASYKPISGLATRTRSSYAESRAMGR
jgi:hypothetical protein